MTWFAVSSGARERISAATPAIWTSGGVQERHVLIRSPNIRAVSADATVYTFTLRDDFYWTDDNPVTAQDVRYGILRTLDPETGSNYAYPLYLIENAEDYNTGAITDTNQVGDDIDTPKEDSILEERATIDADSPAQPRRRGGRGNDEIAISRILRSVSRVCGGTARARS